MWVRLGGIGAQIRPLRDWGDRALELEGFFV